jgi:predicted lipoprotein
MVGLASHTRKRLSILLLAPLLTVSALSACTVVSLEDDRAARERRSDAFDAGKYIKDIWPSKVMPSFGPSAPSLAEILPDLKNSLPNAGARFGRQTGEGSPWTFRAQGDGTVTAIDRASRAGSITVAVETPAGGKIIQIQSGPVISGSAVRDSQAYIAFNDFTNQIAYAKVSSEMNRQALAAASPQLIALKVGDHIHFAGAFALATPDAPVRMIPVAVKVMR